MDWVQICGESFDILLVQIHIVILTSNEDYTPGKNGADLDRLAIRSELIGREWNPLRTGIRVMGPINALVVRL
jgi:hypothetical protein